MAPARSPIAWPTRRAARSTSSSPTRRPSTSPAATWPIARPPSRRSTASTFSSGWRATTSTSAGSSSRPGSRSASRPRPSCGITATRHAPDLLAPAARLRARRGAARAEVAGEIQHARARALGGTPLRSRAAGRDRASAALARVLRSLGKRGVPVERRVPGRAALDAGHAGMVPRAGGARAPRRVGGLLWPPLLYALPAGRRGRGAARGRAPAPARRARGSRGVTRARRWRLRARHRRPPPMQPLARLVGRLGHGLIPWRPRGGRALASPRAKSARAVVRVLAIGRGPRRPRRGRAGGNSRQATHGGEYDRWELETRGGSLGAARVRTALEEHGQGRQLLRCLVWPRLTGSAAGRSA